MADFDLSGVLHLDSRDMVAGANEGTAALKSVSGAVSDLGDAGTAATGKTKVLSDGVDGLAQALGGAANAAKAQASATDGAATSGEALSKAAQKAAINADALALAERKAEQAAAALALAEENLGKAAAGSAAQQKAAADAVTLAQNRSEAALIAVQRAQLRAAAVATESAHAANDNAHGMGNSNIATLELEHSIRAFTDSVNAGQSPVRAFVLELPRLAQAATFAGDALGSVGKFLSGPWGIAVTIGASVLGGLIASSFGAAEGHHKHEEAAKSLSTALKELNATTSKVALENVSELASHVNAAKAIRDQEIATRNLTKARLESAQGDLRAKLSQGGFGDKGDIAGLGAGVASAQVSGLQAQIDAQDRAIGLATTSLREAYVPVIKQLAKEAIDPATRATDRFNEASARLEKQFVTGAISLTEYRRKNDALTESHKAQIDALKSHKGASSEDADAQAALAAATNNVQRAEAEYRLTKISVTAALRDHSISQDEATARLTEAREKVNAAKEAAKDHATALRDQARATREADAASKLLDSTLDGLRKKYEPLVSLASEYAITLAKIAELEAAGKISFAESTTLGVNAMIDNRKQQMAEQRRAFEDADTTAGDTFFKDFGKNNPALAAFGDSIRDGARDGADIFKNGITDAFKTLGNDIGALIGGKTGSAIGKGIGGLSSLFGSDPEQQKRTADFSEAVSKISKGIGISSDAAASIGKYAGKAFGGAAAGEAANQVFAPIAKSIGLKTSNTGAAIGGAAGNILFGKDGLLADLGPLGSLAGGLLGSVIGGLFKSSKYGGATIGDTTTKATTSGNSAKYEGNASSLAGSVQQGIASIAQQLGGTVGSFAPITIGQYNGKYRVQLDGSDHLGGKNHGHPDAYNFDDDQAAAVSFAIQQAITRGAVTGLDAAVQQALGSSTDVNAALAEALNVEKVEALIGGIGFTLKKTFSTFDSTAKDNLAIAQKYGLDIVTLEKNTAEARAKIVTDTIKQSVGSLQDLLTSLQTGDLSDGSAADIRKSILSQISVLQPKAEGGDQDSIDSIQSLYQQLVTKSRDAFGTAGTEYSDDKSAAIAGIQKIIQAETDRVNAAAAQDQANAANLDSIAGNTDEANGLLAEQTTTLKAILAAFQASGSSIGGGSLASAVGRSTNLASS